MPRYPEIETLLGGWFNQDFDLNGDTIDEIVTAYRKVTPLPQQRALVNEIGQFLAANNDIDAAFVEEFKPDISATAFASTTRDFLQEIAALLASQ